MGRRHSLTMLALILALGSTCQESTSRSEALLSVANEHKLSIIIPTSLSDDKVSRMPQASWPLQRKIDYLLDGTAHIGRVESQVIVLQRQSQLYGYVQDAITGEPLAHANIYQSSTDTYTSSNKDGYYSLSFVGDSVELEVTYIGYEDALKWVYPNQGQQAHTIRVHPHNDVPTIIISDQITGDTDSLLLVASQSPDLLLQQTQASSAVGGEPDIFQAVLRQPGITAGADGLGGLHVRGGAHGHNLVTIDGVPLHQSAHAFGIYSIVNNSIVERAYVQKQGITEDQAGRLASVIDIRLKDPDLTQPQLSIQTSSLASQLVTSMPIQAGKSGITVAARRSHVDPIIHRISSDYKGSLGEDGRSLFAFDDQYVKWQYRSDYRQRLTAMFYRSGDRYSDRTSAIYDDSFGSSSNLDIHSDIRWRNQVAQLAYQSTMGSRSIAKVSLSRYQFTYQNNYRGLLVHQVGSPDPLYEQRIINYRSGITDYRLSASIETARDAMRHSYGLTLATRRYQAGEFSQNDVPDELQPTLPPSDPPLTTFTLGDYDSQEMALYYAGDLRLSERVRFRGGLRATVFNSLDLVYNDQVTYLTRAGYLQVAYKINPTSLVGLRACSAAQHEHLLTAGDNAYPSDVWLPSTIATPPAQSIQAEIYATKQYRQGHLRLSIYHKEMQGLVLYDTLATLPALTILEGDTWEQETFLSDARSTGIELQSAWKLCNKVDARLSYTWSRTDFLFSDNIGDLFGSPYDYDMPHVVNLAIAYRPAQKWRIHLDWLYASGRPYTLYLTNLPYSPLSQDSDLDALQVSDYNTDRLPATHKLNIACDYSWTSEHASHQVSLGIQNIYNRQNVLYRYELEGEGVRDQTSFPILPMLRWTTRIGGR